MFRLFFPSSTLTSFPTKGSTPSKFQIVDEEVYKAKMAKRPARPAPAIRAEALSAAPVEAAPAPEPDSVPEAEAESPGLSLVQD